MHDLNADATALPSIANYCQQHGTEDSVLQFASTSKVSFADAEVAFKATLSITSNGPDKVNQLRHTKLFPDMASLKAHMAKHAELLRPRVDEVDRAIQVFDQTFLSGYQAKVPGAEFYPHKMNKEAFKKAEFSNKKGFYSLMKEKDDKLTSTPYSKAYAKPLDEAAKLLKRVAGICACVPRPSPVMTTSLPI